MIAAKRERYTQALCAYSLLAATLQMAVWLMWNSSLYGLAFIYRLNQSKVYIWRIFVNVEMVVYDWVIAVKRKWCAEALCAPLLWATTLQMAIWFMWNSSLYGLAFIYRLNQSKVYMEYFLYLCRCEAVWICYDIAITESQASILVYLSLLVSSDNASDSVVGKSLGIV